MAAGGFGADRVAVDEGSDGGLELALLDALAGAPLGQPGAELGDGTRVGSHGGAMALGESVDFRLERGVGPLRRGLPFGELGVQELLEPVERLIPPHGVLDDLADRHRSARIHLEEAGERRGLGLRRQLGQSGALDHLEDLEGGEAVRRLGDPGGAVDLREVGQLELLVGSAPRQMPLAPVGAAEIAGVGALARRRLARTESSIGFGGGRLRSNSSSSGESACPGAGVRPGRARRRTFRARPARRLPPA